jgi:RNA polymerase sigma factor (sigma-70 family)
MSYNSELVSQMTTPLTVEENLELVPLVAAGDEDAKRRMIEGNIALVLSTVESFIRQYPQFAYLRDDLTGYGFVALITAIGRITDEGDDSIDLRAPVDYIRTCVLHDLGHAVESEATIRIPHTTQHVATTSGNRIKQITASTISPDSCPGDDMQASFDMRDLIESCCETDKDRTFVEMREAGYTLKEIADALGVSTPTVYRLKRELYARVLEKSGLEPRET